MTIGFVNELDYKKKEPLEQLRNPGKITQTQPPKTYTITAGEFIVISHGKFPPCQKNRHLYLIIISIQNLEWTLMMQR